MVVFHRELETQGEEIGLLFLPSRAHAKPVTGLGRLRLRLTEYFAVRLVVLVIGDVIASSVPAYVIIGGVLFGVKKGHHAVVEQAVSLHEIDDVECVFAASAGVFNFKVEPLGEVSSLVVGLQDQLVLAAVDLDCLFKVS